MKTHERPHTGRVCAKRPDVYIYTCVHTGVYVCVYIYIFSTRMPSAAITRSPILGPRGKVGFEGLDVTTQGLKALRSPRVLSVGTLEKT